MSKIRGRLVPVLICAALLLGAANLGAFAATGGPLLLGKSNVANKTTTIKTTGNGPALKLKSKAGKAPFGVSNKVKVKKLNADLVDGLDGSALQNKSYKFTLAGTSAGAIIRFALPGLPAGRYAASFAVNASLGGTPAYFGCLFDSGSPFSNPQFASLGVTSGTTAWYVSAAGLLDTTVLPYTLTCQSDDPGIQIPLSGGVPATVVLTRVDDLTTAPSVGFSARPSSRPGFGR